MITSLVIALAISVVGLGVLATKLERPLHHEDHDRVSEEATEKTSNHEHATAYAKGKFRGFKTTINIWKPRVEKPAEFSLSQLWLVSSYTKNGVPLNTIEAGWQIYPQLYGGNDPRLFVYWTADGYNSTGCYNLRCQGFVQLANSKFLLGKPIFSNTSIEGPLQVEAEFLVFQDRETKNWWLRVAGSYVGFWPASILPDFADGAQEVSCGGEIFYTKRKGQRHTRTQMGSGNFPDSRFGYSAYHRNIEVVNDDFYLRKAKLERRSVKEPGCYDLTAPQIADNSSWGTYFFFGGPGYNSKCLY